MICQYNPKFISNTYLIDNLFMIFFFFNFSFKPRVYTTTKTIIKIDAQKKNEEEKYEDE